MRPISTFKVRPSLPRALAPLERIACNLRWSWDHGAIALFRRLDADLWEASGHNAVLFLGSLQQSQLEAAAKDEALLAPLKCVAEQFEEYSKNEGRWFGREHAPTSELCAAYFSADE